MPESYRVTINQIRQFPDAVFQVVVEGETKTGHTVTLSEDYYSELTEGKNIAVHELVRKAFDFLLERESNVSILKQFNLKDIQRYFPEFEKEISR